MKKLVSKLKIGYAIYIALLLALSLTGCASTKKVEKSDITQKQQTNTEVKNENSTTENGELKKNSTLAIDSSNIKAMQLFENWKKNYQTNTKIYDTTKPIVPGTNRPPLASETTITNIESNDKNLQENSKTNLSKSEIQQLEANFKKKYDSKLDSLTKINTSLKSEVSTKTEQTSNWWKWFLIGLVLGSGITILIYQVKWYVPIWNLIKRIFRR